MRTRKEFIAAAVGTGALLAANNAQAQTTPPKPAPTAAPQLRKASEAARAMAARMREFDSKLTDDDIENIAEGIDQYWQIGRAVNPKGTAFPNSVEPATIFKVIEA